MRKPFTYVLLLMLGSCMTSEPSDSSFEPSWDSMRQYRVPDWFRDAKFGIYFHWGIYSVPAYRTEWYPQRMYLKGHPVNEYHLTQYGSVADFGYKDFIPMFKAEKFNPDQWAELFRKAGARFAGPVAEHADGYAMWDSDLTRFDAKDMGPMIDVVGEMERAVRKQGLKFMTSFHHHWLYGWYPTWDTSSGTADPAYADLYGPVVPPTAWKPTGVEPEPPPDKEFCNRWLSRVVEVMDKYRPDLVYFDSKMHIIDESYRMEMLSHYYNSALEDEREVVVTYKFNDLQPWAGVLDLERSRMKEKKEFPWLTDDSVDWGSWCDVQQPRYKSADRLIDFLVDVVSKNGCVLLNITPTAAGEIPTGVVDRLLEIGAWLKINGEGIYGTRPWNVFGEGPSKIKEGRLNEHENPDMTSEDIRFTTKGDTLYAFLLGVPETTDLIISSLHPDQGFDPGSIASIDLLGSDQHVEWLPGEDGLKLLLEENPGNGDSGLRYAVCFRISLQEGGRLSILNNK